MLVCNVLREWQVRVPGAVAIASAIVLTSAMTVHAELPGPQDGGNGTPLDSTRKGQQQGVSGCEDKLTGDWWGEHQQLERSGITIDADSFSKGLRTSVAD